MNDQVVEIVEVAEARQRANTEEILAVRELNAGVYCFDGPWLWQNIEHAAAATGAEWAGVLSDGHGRPGRQPGTRCLSPCRLTTPDECLGAGTRAELVLVEKAFRRRANPILAG